MWKDPIKPMLAISLLIILGCLLLPKAHAEQGRLQHAPYRLCFTPGGQCTALIVHTIQAAQHSVYVQAYSFTSRPIVKALVQAKQKGLLPRAFR